MKKQLGERTDDEVQTDLVAALDVDCAPRGRSLYRLHRTVHGGLAFGVFWTAFMGMWAHLLRTTPIWTALLIVPSLLYAWHCLRRPYAEFMLCVLDGRPISTSIHLRHEDDRPRVVGLADELKRMTGISPEIRISERFPSDLYH